MDTLNKQKKTIGKESKVLKQLKNPGKEFTSQDLYRICQFDVQVIDEFQFDTYTDLDWGLGITKESYDKFQEKIESTEINRKAYDIKAWCDAGGYEYWSKQVDPNYITISVHIKNGQAYNYDKLYDDYFKVYNELLADKPVSKGKEIINNSLEVKTNELFNSLT